VTRFLEFNSESLKWEPTWIEPTGLRVGTKYKRASRLVQSRSTVSGSMEFNHATKGMGLLWKMALGSTVASPTLISGTAYKQVHQPGDFIGKSMTVQVGRPEPSGTVRAHTYAGVKVTKWEFKVSDNGIATLSVDVDGWSEATATALATAAYTTGAGLFNFSQATVFKLGGTASTSTGVVSIAAGVTVPTVVKSFTISGEAPMAVDRFGLGNAGIKKEQLENDVPVIKGSLDAEFDRSTFYDLFKANTTTAMQLSLVGSQIAATGSFDTIDFVLPAVKFKDAAPSVSGPDIVQAKVDFEVYNDEANATAQVTLISTDSTL
jgi:hypothetical protein